MQDQRSTQSRQEIVYLYSFKTHLTPHQHAAKHHLQAIEEVLPDDDDHGAAIGPALAGADGFDAGGGCREGGGCVSWGRGFKVGL